MKSKTRRRRIRRLSVARRAKLLAAFDRSGLAAATFARKHRLNYTTFCGWRQRRRKAIPSPQFVQIELPPGAGSSGLTIEIGANIRMRVGSAEQIPMAAALLVRLQKEGAC